VAIIDIHLARHFADMLALPALRIRQRDTELFVTAITGGELLRLMEPASGQSLIQADIWLKESNPDGYQRNPETRRVKSISDFLLGKSGVKPLLPQSIILNLRRRAIRFDALHSQDGKKGPSFGVLRIADEAGALWEVDGQHRARGLCDAVKRNPQLREYYLPLTVVAALSRPEEALEFVAINTTQVKVKPDLVLRILWRQYRDHAKAAQRFLGEDIWKIDAVEIVDALNREIESPFHGNIALPGTSVAGKLTSERTFVDSLEPLSGHPELLTHRFVSDFWKAIAAVYPKLASEDEILASSLFKGVGLYVMHKVAPFVANYSEAVESGYELRPLSRSLKSALRPFAPTFWMKSGRVKNFNNRVGYNRLADQIIFSLLSRKAPKVSKKLRRQPRLESEVVKLVTLRNYHAFSESVLKRRLRDRQGPYEGAGAYVLVNLRKQSAYVGMSGVGYDEGLSSRLATHLKEDYDIFHWRRLGTAWMASAVERAGWHAFKGAEWDLTNKRHPEAREYGPCPVCNR